MSYVDCTDIISKEKTTEGNSSGNPSIIIIIKVPVCRI